MKKETAGIPDFQSLEEEKAYWEARGPLAEGNEWKMHKAEPGQKKSSFLNIRLTGKEITQLRDIAARQGVGPSTFARQVLKARINQELTKSENATYYQQPVNSAGYTRDSVDSRVDISDQNGICVFDISSSKVDWDIMQSLLDMLNKMCACKVLTPEDMAYKELKKLINNNGIK